MITPIKSKNIQSIVKSSRQARQEAYGLLGHQANPQTAVQVSGVIGKFNQLNLKK